MKYFSVLLLLIGSLFLGCGSGTDVDTKSVSVTATTTDGETYNFNGDIVLEWDSYTLDNDDKIEIRDVKVNVSGIDYPSSWTWSTKIEDLKTSEISDKETKVPFSFMIKLPKSTVDRSCTLRFTYSLDGDIKHKDKGCVAPAAK